MTSLACAPAALPAGREGLSVTFRARTAGKTIALALVVTAALALFLRARALHEGAAIALSAAGASLEASAKLLEEERYNGLLLLAGTEESDVADPATIEALRASLQEAGEELVAADDLGPVAQGTFDWATMGARAKTEAGMATGMDRTRDDLAGAAGAVEESRALRAVLDARSELQTAVDGAQESLSSSEGRVADEATREALSTEIESALALLSAPATPEDDLGTVTGAQEAVEAAEAAVTESVAALERQRAEEARRAAASAQPPSSARSSSAAQGAWAISYSRGQYLDASGGVTEYFDDYFVAHRSTGTAGQTIASRPATVTVDGVTYRYVSERIAEIGSPYSEIKGWATANGGIALQTCDYTTGRQMALVLHYEPA